MSCTVTPVSGFHSSLAAWVRNRPGDGVVVVETVARAEEPADRVLGRGASDRTERRHVDRPLGRLPHRHPLLDRPLRRQPAARSHGADQERRDRGGRGTAVSHDAPVGPGVMARRAPGPGSSGCWPSGTSGSGDPIRVSPARRGRVSRKRDPWPGSPHACSQPSCSRASSSEIDRPRPVPPVVRARAGSARQNRLKTMAGLARAQADAVVRDGHRDGVVVRRRRDVDRAPLAVLDGVDEEVAQDPLDPARVDLGDRRARPGACTATVAAPALGQRSRPPRPPGRRCRAGRSARRRARRRRRRTG